MWWGYNNINVNAFLASFYASRCRESSKCKTLIKKLISALKIHRRRRECMVRQSRADIEQLRRFGQLREALRRAEQIKADENRLSAYDQIECLCNCISENFSEFKQQSDVHLMPNEVKEAIAGLIFAASRVGELLELQSIRVLFRQRFGRDFDRDSVELRSGNAVGWQIRKILDEKATMPPREVTPPEILMMGIANKDRVRTSEAITHDSTIALNGDDNRVEKTKNEKKEKMKTVIRVRGWLERVTEKRKMAQKKHDRPNSLPDNEEDFGG